MNNNTLKPKNIVAPKYVYMDGDRTEIYVICLSIVNGLSMDQIDPTLYPQIQVNLKQDRERYQVQGNKSAVDQINKSLAFIYDYNIEQQRKDEKMRYLSEIAFTDADVQQCLQDVIEGKEVDLRTPQFRKALMQKFRTAKYEAIQKTDYVLADAIERGINGLIVFENQEKVLKAQERLLNQKSKRMQRVQNSIDRKEKSWDIEIQNTENQKNREIDNLKKCKERDLKRFESEWAKSPKQPFRPSTYLIDAKRKVDFYKNLERCDALDEALKAANDLEAKEKKDYQDHLDLEYNRRCGDIESKYDNRISEKETFYTNTLQRMRNQKESDINSLKKGLAFLESRHLMGVDESMIVVEDKSSDEEDSSQLPPLSPKPNTSSQPSPPREARTTQRSPRRTPHTARTPRSPRSPRIANNEPEYQLTESRAKFVQRRAYNYLLYTRANVKSPSKRVVD
ncbi:hypothetical protein TVAG_438330 [Trichomonas vaginalis G3]|uniref:Uncharacterized protein n=1 Tax=Trichomonas vaginalis (strain ATCC PRA-98 / G3) TaxID=412133 RepID=A2EYM9_TRIV3|nr:hypothetical protein TVAGG3_0672280 [Trichomonas vaginalis G3]EAY02242.1 hypothetical protein TVAG_438330 [Trichomonas vaginalis G3]KAI5507286.1 hypothetical protein TVAGG3_0672280 [Trichomonas vaginalis G3]|eukprot:XP_001330601.1 hypothetical protein [Trichomonas vaginalis G3]